MMVSKKQIPDHWEWRNLSELCDLESGKRPKGSVSDYKGKIPSIGGGEIKSNGNFKTRDISRIPEEFFDNKMTRGKIEEGDILVVKDGATTGKTAYVGEDFPFDKAAINSHVYIVRSSKRIYSKFLYYIISSSYGQNRIQDNFHGAAQGGINMSFADNFKTPVPPLEEQKSIVKKLNEVFDSIEEIQEAQEQAEGIYQDLTFSFFTSRVRAAETETVDTGDLIEATQYGSSNATNSEGDGHPSLRMGNYNLRGEMDYSKIKYQEFEDEEQFKKYKLKDGDVLFNRTNSSDLVGKMCIYDGGLEDAVFASYLIRVELDESKVLPEYFVTYMNSHLGEVERQGKLKQAVSQANINATELREMEMAIPSIEAQNEIVGSLEYMRSKIDGIMSKVNKKGSLVENLPKSVLREAFKGDLIDFDPNLDPHPEVESESNESNAGKEGQQRLEEFD